MPRGVNEMMEAGLEAEPSRFVKPPRVKASPCALECALLQIIPLADLDGRPLDTHVVIGQVIGVHIDDRFIRDGQLDTAAMKPLARCGYHNYAVVESEFRMVRPTKA
jgi:flavin reductase (DIM6/NTAB) family NADH-FMN oxidoreductase RutF